MGDMEDDLKTLEDELKEMEDDFVTLKNNVIKESQSFCLLPLMPMWLLTQQKQTEPLLRH